SSPRPVSRCPATSCASASRRTASTCSTSSRARPSPARRGRSVVAADGARIVIVGAGGWVFPLELIRDLFSFPGLHGSTGVLFDIDVAAAQRTLEARAELREIGRVPASVVVAAELREALRGADVVLTVFQVGGVDADAFDVEIPREFGVDQTVGDTLGPGGVFRGLRTVPALREVAEAMLDVCPDALLLNYANPMSANCWATDL